MTTSDPVSNTPKVLLQIATSLLEENVRPEIVARTLNIPVEIINQLPHQRRRRSVEIEQVSEETAAIVGLAIDQAEDILLNGTPAMRLRLITSLLGKAMSQLRNQSPKAMEALRAHVDKLTATVMDDETDDEDDDDDDEKWVDPPTKSDSPR